MNANESNKFLINQTYRCITGRGPAFRITDTGWDIATGRRAVWAKCRGGEERKHLVSVDSQGREVIRPMGNYDGCIILRAGGRS